MVQPSQSSAPGFNTDEFGTCQSTARTTKPPKYITTSKWKDDTNPYTLGHNWQQQMGSFVYRLPQRLVNCQHMAEFATNFPDSGKWVHPQHGTQKTPTCIQLIPLQLQQEFSTLEDTISYASDTQQRSEMTNKKTTHTYPPGTIIKQSP